MKKLTYLLLILALIGCKPDKTELEIFHYPSEIEFDTRLQLKTIDLDTTSLTYLDICRMIPEDDYRKYAPLFEIEDGPIKRRIVPFVPSYYTKRKNIITVTRDSIFADKGFSIRKLDGVMNKIFSNYGQTNFYGDDYPYLARLAIDMESNSSGKEIKQLLLKITKAFDHVDKTQSDSLFLKIYFDFPLDYNPLLENR